MSDGPTLIQSVRRALRLLELVAEHHGRAQAKEIARAAGLPLATTYHLLRTCVHEGWLQRLDDGSYVLGHRIDVVREHGTAARGIAHARPALEWLRDTIGGPVYLARYVDGEVVVADIVDCSRVRRLEMWVGVHDAAHATALGKSILGQLPPAGRDDYFDRHPLRDFTARTVVDRRRLRLPEPGQIAVDDGEVAVGVSCLAAAVRAPEGPGAVAVVVSPGAVRRPAERQALLSGAARASRALTIGRGLG
jgi:IclR family transcriptional regulator, acetate operon repressor